MALIDYVPNILKAVADAGEINQGDLTEAVWGTSGRGNKTLTQTVFPYLVIDKRMLAQRKRGRAIMFSITDKGRDYLARNQDKLIG